MKAETPRWKRYSVGFSPACSSPGRPMPSAVQRAEESSLERESRAMRAVLGAERLTTRAIRATARGRDGDAPALGRAECRVPHFHGLLVRSAGQTRAVRQRRRRTHVAHDVRGGAVRTVDVAGRAHLAARQRRVRAIAARGDVGARRGARAELPSRDLTAETGEPGRARTT